MASERFQYLGRGDLPVPGAIGRTINEMVESGEIIEEFDDHGDTVYHLAPAAEVNGVSIFDPSRALDRAIVMLQGVIDDISEDPTPELDDLKKIMYALKQELENREAVAQALAGALDRVGMDPIDAMTKAIALLEELKRPDQLTATDILGRAALATLTAAQSYIRDKW